jgi:hypothetical protein
MVDETVGGVSDEDHSSGLLQIQTGRDFDEKSLREVCKFSLK